MSCLEKIIGCFVTAIVRRSFGRFAHGSVEYCMRFYISANVIDACSRTHALASLSNRATPFAVLPCSPWPV